MQYRHLPLLLLGLIAAAACDDDDPVSPTGEAQVRVANVSPTVSTVDVLVDGQVVAQNVTFGPGQCVSVPAGAQTIAFRANGNIIASETGTVVAGERYTALLFNNAAGTPDAGVVEVDVAQPAAGVNALRFINVTGMAGDLFLTEPATTPSGAPDIAALASGTATPFGTAPAAESRARLFPVGETTNPISDVTIPTLTNRIGTVVFVGAGAPGGQTGLAFEPCPMS